MNKKTYLRGLDTRCNGRLSEVRSWTSRTQVRTGPDTKGPGPGPGPDAADLDPES